MFTIGNWILFGLVLLGGISLAVVAFCDDEPAFGLGIILITLILVGGMMVGIGWYHNNTASGSRAMRDYHSNLENGYDREITITAEDGRVIYHYEGKIDIETDHTDNYILFDDTEGKRHIIYYGIQDTVLIVDK